MGLLSIFILTNCGRVAVNPTLFKQKAIVEKEYTKSKFLTINPCMVGFTLGEQQDSSFTHATCALTKKQLIVFSTAKNGEVLEKLFYLDFKDIKNAGYYELGLGSQLQLKTQTGTMSIITLKDGFIYDNESNKKYLETLKAYGIKDFNPTYGIYSSTPTMIFVPI